MFYFAADIQYNSLFFSGCIAVTSAEDGSAETTQYLILQGPDDGKYHQYKDLKLNHCLVTPIWTHIRFDM